MKSILSLLTILLSSQFTWAQDLTIKSIDECIIVSKAKDKKPIHSISGIDYIPATRQWNLASDRGNYFQLDAINHPADLIALSDNATPIETAYQFEAIRYDSISKTFFFAVEANNITYVSSSGPFPRTADFYLSTSLMYPNSGVEAIALTKDHLWVAPERGWNFKEYDTTGRIHFYRYGRNSEGRFSTMEGPEQFVYELDKDARNKCGTEPLGISELIAVDENRLLVLERCYPYRDKGSDTNRVYARLSAVSVETSGGQHVLKRLKINQQDAYEFSPTCMDNLEGMTWWIDPKTNKRILVVISDDNADWSTTQRTIIKLLQVD